jgi:hypothetical protein
MPGYDLFHERVKQALINDQWQITHDPLTVQFGTTTVFIDLGAEKLIAAEKAGRRIAVEIKSFLNPSIVTDFHLAVGQVLNYQVALDEQDPQRILYLAVPLDVYSIFFVQPIIKTIIARYQLRLVIYEAEREEIVQWID